MWNLWILEEKQWYLDNNTNPTLARKAGATSEDLRVGKIQGRFISHCEHIIKQRDLVNNI